MTIVHRNNTDSGKRSYATIAAIPAHHPENPAVSASHNRAETDRRYRREWRTRPPRAQSRH